MSKTEKPLKIKKANKVLFITIRDAEPAREPDRREYQQLLDRNKRARANVLC